MPYCKPQGNEVQELNLKTVKPGARIFQKEGPLVESPTAMELVESPEAMDLEENSPEGSPLDVRAVSHSLRPPSLTSIFQFCPASLVPWNKQTVAGTTQPSCLPPCEGPHCRNCGRRSGLYSTDVR